MGPNHSSYWLNAFGSNRKYVPKCFLIRWQTQVGIILTLVWPQKAQLVPSGYPNSVAEGNPGTCFGIPTRDDALAWLERRALHIREEIAVAEVRLQSLHQDLAVLKVTAEQYHRHLQGNGES